MTQSQSLKEQLLKLKESGKGAISTPYDVSIFGDLMANGLNFGKITCSENTMGHIITAVNSFDTLIDITIGLAEALEKFILPTGTTCSEDAYQYDLVASKAFSEAAEKVRGMR